jgi:2-haloacid dehalogenase
MTSSKAQTSIDSPWNGGSRPSVLIFDVNETLIDFHSLNPLFHRVFGDERVMREWLGHLVLYSMTITLAGLYEDYWSLGAGLFRMVGAIHAVEVTSQDVEALVNGMKTLPAHPDAAEGLQMLKRAGFQLVTLTNSPPTPGAPSPLENAGLATYIEKQFNIESARAYKPAPIVYHMVAQDLGVQPAACCMVATHVWDTIGAQAAGLAGALLTRPGNALLPVSGLPQPNLVGGDLPDLAAQMIELWR